MHAPPAAALPRRPSSSAVPPPAALPRRSSSSGGPPPTPAPPPTRASPAAPFSDASSELLLRRPSPDANSSPDASSSADASSSGSSSPGKRSGVSGYKRCFRYVRMKEEGCEDLKETWLMTEYSLPDDLNVKEEYRDCVLAVLKVKPPGRR